jgi:uncharacterized protein involved in type VI secretion and phage assembly
MEMAESPTLLTIYTILDDQEKGDDGNAFQLAKVDGQEAISQPYSYKLTLLREVGGLEGKNRGQLDITRLIGTNAVFGVRPSTDRVFTFRSGMIDTVEESIGIDITKVKPLVVSTFLDINVVDFRIYNVTVVPWIKVLERDICYRIFERKTVVQIIDAILTQVKHHFSYLDIDTTALNKHGFPIIEYCVQFNESTLAFLSRLMARFGIYYYFGTNNKTLNINQTMVLKSKWNDDLPPWIDFSDLDTRNVSIKDDDPDEYTIAKLVRRWRAPERKVVVGGFNQLKPVDPFYEGVKVRPEYDLLQAEDGHNAALHTQWFGSTTFAEPVNCTQDVKDLAEVRSYADQSPVITVSGITKNPTFATGHRFKIVGDTMENDENDYLVNRELILQSATLYCHDYSYINVKGWWLLDVAFPTFSVLGDDGLSFTDAAAAKVSLWVSNNAQNQVLPIGPPRNNQNPPGQLWSPTYWSDQSPHDVFGSALSTAFWLCVQSFDLKKVINDAKNMKVYKCGFVALPTKGDPPQAPTLPVDLPLPVSVRPVARGPHTAVVIGRDDGQGVDDVKQGHDIWADALGRVRVRFPWDPGPPAKSDSKAIPPVFPVFTPSQPTTVGGNTCWLRVAEGWGGRHYGIQFLPRIGQEVLVDFLDGDPEQPVVVGRLYNADQGTTNLPFPPNLWGGTTFNQVSDLRTTGSEDFRFSGIKTWSLPTSDSNADSKEKNPRFHLLRFDDTRGREQYLIRSQGRLDMTVFNHRYENIGGDRNLTVGGKSYDETKPTRPPLEIHGDYIAKIYKHYHLHVGDPDFLAASGDKSSGNRITRLEQNEELSVGKNYQLDAGTYSAVTGNYYLHVSGRPGGGGKRDTIIDSDDRLLVQGDLSQMIAGEWKTKLAKQMSVQSDTTIALEGFSNISLKVSDTSIVLTPAGIFLTAPQIVANEEVVMVSGAAGTPATPSAPSVPSVDDPKVPPPLEPTPADAGDSVKPADWQALHSDK